VGFGNGRRPNCGYLEREPLYSNYVSNFDGEDHVVGELEWRDALI